MIIRVFDIESSGLNPEVDQVLECGWTDITLPSRTISDPKSYLCGTSVKISPENRAIHHINPATLIGRKPFDSDAFNQAAIEDGVTCLAAFNADFDVSFVKPTLPVICLYKCALRAWPEMTKHSNAAVFYALEEMGLCKSANYAHITAHRAGPDSYVSAWIMKALLDAGITGKAMLAWSKEPPLLPRCPIGKYKNQPWADCDTGWLQWLAYKSDMDDNLKWNARRVLGERATPDSHP